MRLTKLFLVVALVLAPVVYAFPTHASDVSLGAGAAYFTQTKGTVPYIEGAYSFTARKAASVTWAKDDGTNHAFGALDLKVGEAPFVLGDLFIRLGGGAYWTVFDDWKAELVTGAGLKCPFGIFSGTLGYNRIQAGGKGDPTNVFYAGVSVLGPAGSRK